MCLPFSRKLFSIGVFTRRAVGWWPLEMATAWGLEKMLSSGSVVSKT